jgi:intracellular sulfur oxidation DsrE/DsrF family protein
VLRKWKIPAYLDETYTIIPPNAGPFWYCNTLNIMVPAKNTLSMDASDGPGNLPDDHLIQLKAQLVNVYTELASSDKIGLISLYSHPTTYATHEFWDKLNYSRGKNPPDGKISKPKVKTGSRIETDLQNLENFVVLAKSMKDIHFITASDAVELYNDKAKGREFNVAELRSLCKRSLRAINFQALEPDVWLSPAEIFSMVLESLSHYCEKGVLPGGVQVIQPYGPKTGHESEIKEEEVDLELFFQACSHVLEELRLSPQLPSIVQLDRLRLSPTDMFATCCAIYIKLSNGEAFDKIPIQRGNFEVGKNVTEEGARTDWKRTYLNPDGFTAMKQVEIARLQTWTLKPAVPDLSQLKAMSKNRSVENC